MERLRAHSAALLRLVVIALAGVLAATAWPSATTTFVHVAKYSYDVPSVSRVDVQPNETAKPSSDLRAASQDSPISRSAVSRGASTTPSHAFIATNTATIESGNYVVSTPRGEYVGQSGNISNRLDQHVASGKFTQAEVAAAQRISVPGSKLDREIAEQLLIDSKGGVPNLVNVVNPIGPKRFGVMPNQPYVR